MNNDTTIIMIRHPKPKKKRIFMRGKSMRLEYPVWADHVWALLSDWRRHQAADQETLIVVNL